MHLTISLNSKHLLLLLQLLFIGSSAYGNSRSVMLERIFQLSDSVSSIPWSYKATYYYRAAVSLKKKNALIVSTPNRRYYMKDGKNLITEDIGNIEYYFPSTFSRKVRQTYGTSPIYNVSHGYIKEFFNLTPHAVYLLADHILSPLHRKNIAYYKYSLDSVRNKKAFFSFKQKRRNMQLVSGTFIFNISQNHIERLRFSGRYNFITFTEEIVMGTQKDQRFWPKHITMNYEYWYYGNIFTGTTHYHHNYESIRRRIHIPKEGESRRDLTHRYTLVLDTASAIFDSAHIAHKRLVPLTHNDSIIYAQNRFPLDSLLLSTSDTLRIKRATPRWLKSIGRVGEFFFNDYDLMTTSFSTLRVLSPTIGYSGTNGITYRQDIDYTKKSANERFWSLTPSIAYSFKTNEFSGTLRSRHLLQPRHDGMLTIEMGMQHITANDNYSFLNGQKLATPTTTTPFEFIDFYTNLSASREISNGFDVAIGLSAHQRQAKHTTRKLLDIASMRHSYREVAPNITLSYTPHQYYYRNGKRKIRLYSHYPTFLINYERGIKGLFGSTDNYERLETTISHSLKLTPVHRLMIKFGGGMFTSRDNTSFVQYEYFNNGITAYNWDDDRSGVFQLLDRRYYHNSYHYLRGHIVIESPMLLLGNFSTHIVKAERLYLNSLMTEGLVPYMEIGYGVSNELLDISIFASYLKAEAFKTGIKFNLHIFN